MALRKDTAYGFVSHDDIEDAITRKLQNLDAGKLDKVSNCLSEAVAALLAINASIPVQSRHRHLVSEPLEKFAEDGAGN